MPNKRISELTAITTLGTADVFPVVVDGATETNKITYDSFKTQISTDILPDLTKVYIGARSFTQQYASIINTPYKIQLADTIASNGISLSNSTRINFSYDGFFIINYTLQVANANNQLQDIRLWLARNNTFIESTQNFISIPNSHGSVSGHTLVTGSYMIGCSNGDYIEFLWQSSSTQVTLISYPEDAGKPAVASAKVLIQKIN
jgi:hypothetical protein